MTKNFRYAIVGFVVGALPGPIVWYMRTGSIDGYSMFLLLIGGVTGAIAGKKSGESDNNLWGAVWGGLLGSGLGILLAFNGM